SPCQIRCGSVHVCALGDRRGARFIHIPIRVGIGRLILPSPDSVVRLLVTHPEVVRLGRRLGHHCKQKASFCIVVVGSENPALIRARRLRLVEGDTGRCRMVA
ncbi:hypothetical protein PENTCL1PPCAC_25325, partial [Pristionchus entomophagus]